MKHHGNPRHGSRGRGLTGGTLLVAAAICALPLAGCSIAETGSTNHQSDTSQEGDMGPSGENGPHTTRVLPEEMSGQEAIDALGDKIDVVAKRIGKTPDELKEMLLKNPSAHVTPYGNVVFKDNFGK